MFFIIKKKQKQKNWLDQNFLQRKNDRVFYQFQQVSLFCFLSQVWRLWKAAKT